MTLTEKQKIVDSLLSRGANHRCSRCSQEKFTLLDGYFNQNIQKILKTSADGYHSVRSVVVICNNCGYMSQHALGALESMSKKENEYASSL